MPAVSIPATVSTTLVVANYNRTVLIISNPSTLANIHISFGGTATTNDGFISPGGNMTLAGNRAFLGQINAISSSGTVSVKYSEASPGK